jgi:hypothetical protein
MEPPQYHRQFNIIDARHDGQKTKTPGGNNICNDKLFKDALTLLFNDYAGLDRPHLAGNEEEYSIRVQYGERIGDIRFGQKDNLSPEAFKQEPIQTLSQIYDAASKTYKPMKPIGFPSNGINMTDSLTPFGFTGWYITAIYSNPIGAIGKTDFILHYGQAYGDKLNFRVGVQIDGWYVDGNHTDPDGDDSNYIRGNTEKNRAIHDNNAIYANLVPGILSQAELIRLASKNTRQGNILNSAVGRVGSKVLGDLWHMINKQQGTDKLTVHSSDNYLAKRAAYMRYPTVLRRQTGATMWFLYFPGGNDILADRAYNLASTITGGVFNELHNVVVWINTIGWFGFVILEHTRVNNKGPIHDIIIRNECSGGCNRTSKVATCYTDHSNGEAIILVGPIPNGIYNRTRHATAASSIDQIFYTNEYLVTGINIQQTTINVILIFLVIAASIFFARREGGGDKMPMKEEVPKHSDMNLNQQKLYLSSEYDKYIKHLSDFLKVKKVRISGEKEEIECPTHIVNYIQHVIAMFTAYKESALQFVKTDEDIFRWVPSQIIFHTDFMKIPQYTEGPAYYAPLKVSKLFPHLDDATVSRSFVLENNFGAYSTFYDFFTESKDTQPAYVIPDTPLVFEELLIFLDGEYSDNEKVEDMTDKIPTNFGDGDVKFAEQIRWFQKNGVTLENSQIFADLLADTMSRQCIVATQIAPIIFKELAKGDVILGYTLYNQCYPHLFASTKYFIRFDIYVDLVRQLNSSGEIKHDLLHDIESKIQQDYANRLLEHATGVAREMGIDTLDSLYKYCETLTVTEEDLYEFGDKINELLVYPSGASPVFLKRFGEISNKMFGIIKEKNKPSVGIKSKQSGKINPYTEMKFQQPKGTYREELPEDTYREELPPPPPPILLTTRGRGGRKTSKRMKKHSKRVNNKHKKLTRRKTVKCKH